MLFLGWTSATIMMGEWLSHNYGSEYRSDFWAFSLSAVTCYLITIGLFLF